MYIQLNMESAVSASVQTQFDMALAFLRHQLAEQPAMTSPPRDVIAGCSAS